MYGRRNAIFFHSPSAIAGSPNAAGVRRDTLQRAGELPLLMSRSASSWQRARSAALYAAAWLPLVVVYAAALEVMSAGAIPLTDTILAAIANLAAPAVLGGAVWLVSRRLPWRDVDSARFFAVHTVLATLFTIAWIAWELLLLGPTGPVRPPDYEMWRYVLPWQALIGFILYGVVAGVSYAVRGVARARDLTVSAERSDRLRAQAELAALRAHINPHFLFNTLHAVMQLQREDPRHGDAALEHMADLFAYVLRLERHGVELVALEDEWRFTESYLWLERTRLGEKLRVESCMDEEALACSIPPFTIQPLVENAIRHGIVPSRRGGTVRIAAHESGGTLEIEVTDDGVGADPALLDDSKGLGERVVGRRLAARYGARATASVKTAPGTGYRVSISLPAEAHVATPRPAGRRA